MREIKFRAWDKPQSKMRNVRRFVFEEGLLASAFLVDGDDVLGVWRTSGDFEPLAFTGLKDKNSKEIYEGDIVTVPNYSYDPSNGDSPVNIDTIEFREASFRLKEQCDPIDEDECSENVEVIGNIYENPDLLK